MERGLAISASCVCRWVEIYGPELDKRRRRHLKPTNKSWRLDETYIKVKGQERFLYRAVDSSGQIIDFLLTAKRDATAGKRLRRPLAKTGNPLPRVINVHKNSAYPVEVEDLKQDGQLLTGLVAHVVSRIGASAPIRAVTTTISIRIGLFADCLPAT